MSKKRDRALALLRERWREMGELAFEKMSTGAINGLSRTIGHALDLAAEGDEKAAAAVLNLIQEQNQNG